MNRFLITARTIARKTGLKPLLHRLRPSTSYEEHFHEALVRSVKPGDVVWDIGANVGVYTELFCDWVGENGAVVAFEPGVEAYESIRTRIPSCAWLTIENAALSDSDMLGNLVVQGGGFSVYNHITTDANPADADAETIPVVICRADTVAKRLGKTPNVVKVDVEGFEEDVLLGFGDLLRARELRSVLVEVHFGRLEERGRAAAPVRIEKMLKNAGFRVDWVDPSHIDATR